jgi:hypothetical protein
VQIMTWKLLSVCIASLEQQDLLRFARLTVRSGVNNGENVQPGLPRGSSGRDLGAACSVAGTSNNASRRLRGLHGTGAARQQSAWPGRRPHVVSSNLVIHPHSADAGTGAKEVTFSQSHALA